MTELLTRILAHYNLNDCTAIGYYQALNNYQVQINNYSKNCGDEAVEHFLRFLKIYSDSYETDYFTYEFQFQGALITVDFASNDE